MKRIERKAMQMFEEDFIEDVVEKAHSKVKKELTRIISDMLSSEDYEKAIRMKIREYVDSLISEEIEDAVKRVESLKKDALEQIKSARKNAFLKLNNYTPSDIDEERVAKIEKMIESLRNELSSVKSGNQSQREFNGTTYTMHGGQMCGKVYCNLVKVFGGQIIHLEADKVEKVYGKNDVTKFFYYMWNDWSEAECMKVFKDAPCEYIWNKWCNYVSEYGRDAAISVFYANIDNGLKNLLVSRAIEKYS